jgi:hypothetical protein
MDLRNGYHQLELSDDFRNITTFTTHVGLRRYKRLSFGVSSAAEIFQNTQRKIALFGSLISTHKRISLGFFALGATTIGDTQGVGPSTFSMIFNFKSLEFGFHNLKDVKVKINVNENVKPVIQPLRRIPFHIRKQVEAELQRLEIKYH